MSALSMMPKVVDVLRWYADDANYMHGDTYWFGGEPVADTIPVVADLGERARIMLAELEKDGQA